MLIISLGAILSAGAQVMATTALTLCWALPCALWDDQMAIQHAAGLYSLLCVGVLLSKTVRIVAWVSKEGWWHCS